MDLDLPEHFLGFFEDRYPEFAHVVGDRVGPAGTYHLAVGLYHAYLGLFTHDVFAGWEDTNPELHVAWVDAGERLRPRLEDLHGEIARGETEFPAAAELACAAVKHRVDPPAPFTALDTEAYRDHGADYAIQWARKTMEKLE